MVFQHILILNRSLFQLEFFKKNLEWGQIIPPSYAYEF